MIYLRSLPILDSDLPTHDSSAFSINSPLSSAFITPSLQPASQRHLLSHFATIPHLLLHITPCCSIILLLKQPAAEPTCRRTNLLHTTPGYQHFHPHHQQSASQAHTFSSTAHQEAQYLLEYEIQKELLTPYQPDQKLSQDS